MDQNLKLKRKENIITADMNGSAVTMNISTGKYYNLGETGGDIWKHLKDEISFGELVAKISAEYEIQPGECEADIAQFVEKLIADGLVNIL